MSKLNELKKVVGKLEEGKIFIPMGGPKGRVEKALDKAKDDGKDIYTTEELEAIFYEALGEYLGTI